MKTKILKLKSTLLKSKYGSKMVLFKYYWKCEMDRLNQETQKLRLLFWIQKKGFHVAVYDEELIEDAFSEIFNNTKVVTIVHNNTKCLYGVMEQMTTILFEKKLLIIFQLLMLIKSSETFYWEGV